MHWLNEYIEAMAEQVVKHGGIINKYVGDAIMAIFGVPVARKTEAAIGKDAANAVNCALAMENKLVQLNSIWEERDLPNVGMRIGIFTGPLVAGSLGSADRLEYAVIGDTVNIASRLESFDKSGFDPDFKTNTCRILIGEATYQYIADRFKAQRLGEVTLKGQESKTAIYRVERE
jgi:adenylate cyclase